MDTRMDPAQLALLYSSFLVALLLIMLTEYAETPLKTKHKKPMNHTQKTTPQQDVPVTTEREFDVSSFFA